MSVGAATGADGVRWDLTPLAPSEEAMKARTDAAVADAAAFVERHPTEAIQAIEPQALAELLRELAALRASRSEAAQWSFLLQWSDGDDPATPDIAAWVEERLPRLDEAIRHFELAWMAMPDERARSIADDEQVAADRHYLLAVRRFARALAAHHPIQRGAEGIDVGPGALGPAQVLLDRCVARRQDALRLRRCAG